MKIKWTIFFSWNQNFYHWKKCFSMITHPNFMTFFRWITDGASKKRNILIDSISKNSRNSRYRNNTKSQRSQLPAPLKNATETFSSRYFLCRSGDERDKWLQCLRAVSDPDPQSEKRHAENSLQVSKIKFHINSKNIDSKNEINILLLIFI
jgi:hypothetical protein